MPSWVKQWLGFAACVIMRILRGLAKNKTLRYGVPMMLLIIGGSFGLREFAQIRYDAHKLHSTKIKDASFDDWKNIRGPRPWEESNTLQEQQR
ncbi:cytochrome c oxidase assembly protein COX16 homolog, mitochondrial isoform X2 [Heteronotia binoei]|uniref:cytochrome c oxidase assembly protein COX16 homolog, mitochondrial isoform X2 n=1 Tax=Heteronotia binoei TaxID=13085 RepID=UPI00292FDB27|nr:cytochrome c oxidase assembly protein COX16 homolog, mitochondrial isoform X2 [Heteronotia binoei]